MMMIRLLRMRCIPALVLATTLAFTSACGGGGRDDGADAPERTSPTIGPMADDTEPDLITESDTGPGAYDPLSADAIGEWRAAGNEPFWAVRVDSAGIVFMTPDNQEGQRFPISVPVRDGDVLRFTTTTAATPSHDLVLELVAERCPDSMSDKVWTHVARATVDGTRYTGCAESTRR